MPESTPPPARHRLAARVLLLDAEGATLLFRETAPDRPDEGSWWITPGGGVEAGESLQDAARREVLEETGVALGLMIGPVHHDRTGFVFEGQAYDQEQHYFVAPVDHPQIDDSRWTPYERRSILDHRWWSVAELRATTDTLYPAGLADLIEAARRELAATRPGPL